MKKVFEKKETGTEFPMQFKKNKKRLSHIKGKY